MTTKDKSADTPLPPVGHNGTADHVQMSERFQGHTKIEIGKGNRLQASEKIWASVAHILKAIAERRGWTHNSHPLLRYVSEQMGRERGMDDEYARYYALAESMHTNFYENRVGWTNIRAAQRSSEAFIEMLKQDLKRHPGMFNIETTDDRDRMNHLGRPQHKGGPRRMPKVKVGDTSPHGFSPNFAPGAVGK